MPKVAKRRRRTAPVPRKLPSTDRSSVTVEAIVTAVERVLESHGASGLNTNRVAEIAGVSVGSLYQYFPNKESLVAALQERYIQQTVGFCRAALASADTVPLETIVDRMATALLAAYRAQRPIHRWLVELRSAAAYHERRRRAIEEYAGETAVFLSTRADLQLADPAATAFVLVHAVEGVVNATITGGGDGDVAAITRETCRMLCAYIAGWPRERGDRDQGAL